MNFVYEITNNINNKKYIGVTKSPITRFKAHKNAKTDLGTDIRNLGVENFNMQIIFEHEDRRICYIEEQKNIESKNTVYPYGYNTSSGLYSDGNSDLSEEKIKRIYFRTQNTSKSDLEISLDEDISIGTVYRIRHKKCHFDILHKLN